MNDAINNLKSKIQQQEKKMYKSAADWVDDWIDLGIRQKESPLMFGFDQIDEDLKGNMRGSLGAFIGYGGTKKSLLALNILNLNINLSSACGIYSTMEMPATLLLNRMIDFALPPVEDNRLNYKISRAEHLYNKLTKENQKEIASELKIGLSKYYGNNLAITQQSRMTVDDYDTLIKRYKQDHENLDCLVVDGLSMMKSIGTENESYTTHSAELKDLAKDHNIFISLICHLSKGATVYDRDTSVYVRGSQKILDNVDFYSCLSLLEGEDKKPRKDIGWIRFINKRFSGNQIDVIYDFDPYKMMMKESELNAKDFEW